MSKLTNKLYFKALAVKNNAIKFLKNEKGDTNFISIIIILAIVIALAVIFKSKITTIFDNIWSKIGSDVNNAY